MAPSNSIPDFVKESEAYRKAQAFLEEASAKEGVEYKWVFEYAKWLWEYRNKVFVSLDEKAEAIIKYLGGGTGLFALGVIAKVDASNNYVALSALPALGCALVAIYFAFRSKTPSPFPGLPTAQNATDYAEDKKNENAAIASFLGPLNQACENARLVCQRKAEGVERAAGLAYVALCLLLVPLVVAICWPH